MYRYLLKRILFALLALFVLMSLVFFLMVSLPIIPLQRQPRETVANYQARLRAIGHYLPILERYFQYWRGFFQGNFGVVFNVEATSLTTYFFRNVPNTLYVASIAFVLSIMLGYIFGVIAGVYRGKWPDMLVNVISILFVSIPSFVMGILLLRLAGVIGLPQVFHNFGSYGFSSSTFVAASVMPILSLTFGLASTLTYYIRNELVEVLQQEYIKTARSKGLSQSQIIFQHALRNVSIPLLAIIGPSFLFVITGSIVLEQIFGVKGLANILYEATLGNQYYLVLFETFFISGLYFSIIIIIDILYTVIDPRIKLAQSSQFVVWQTIKAYALRYHFRKQWTNAATSKEYFQLHKNTPLYEALEQQRSFNYHQKTVVIKPQMFQTYSLSTFTRYLVVGKDVFKIIKGGVND